MDTAARAARLKLGDVSDPDLLFAAHRAGVFRYLCRTVGHTEAARDLTQEVFLRVTRASAPQADEAGLRAWIYRIARNLALNHLRDGRRRPVTVALVDRAAPASQELALAIAEALDTLQELDRDVFLLRETAGLSYREIAGTCEISEEAVRARLYRARIALRAALAGPLSQHRRDPVLLARGEDR